MSLKVREGGAWIKVSDGANGANGLGGTDAKVLQEQYKESNSVVTITQRNVFPITGLSVNIIPLSSTSKLLLEANIMSNAFYVSSFGFSLLQGSTWTPIGGNEGTVEIFNNTTNTNVNSTNAISTLYSYGDSWASRPLIPFGPLQSSAAENMYSATYRYLYTQSGPNPVGGFTFIPTACSPFIIIDNQFNYSVCTIIINNRQNNDMLSTSSITVKEIEV